MKGVIECDAARRLPSKCLFLRKQRETLETFRSFLFTTKSDEYAAKCLSLRESIAAAPWINVLWPIAFDTPSSLYRSTSSSSSRRKSTDIYLADTETRSMLACWTKYLRISRASVPTDRDTVLSQRPVCGNFVLKRRVFPVPVFHGIGYYFVAAIG